MEKALGPTLAGVTAPQRVTASQWKMTLLASLGSGLEYYDFIVYGIFAQYIAAAFFPAHDPLVSLTLSFGVFAIGYLARPLGGIVLASLGDRYGRKRVFVGTVSVMSLTLLLMGILPTYAQWGVWASIALVALRFIQGLCVGGELPGAITYAVETVPLRAGFVCGIVYAFVNAGVLLATFTNLTLQGVLTLDQMAALGWRIAFVFGGVLGIVSFWLRRSLEETPEFLRMKDIAAHGQPVKEVVRNHRMPLVLGFCVCALTAGFNGILFTHMPAYAGKVLDYDRQAVASAMNWALVVMTVVIVMVSWLADRMPRHLILRCSAALLVLLSAPIYYLINAHAASLTLMLGLLGAAAAIANGSFACVLADLFPTRVRFSGVALSLNLSFTLLSGLAPLIATSLMSWTGWLLSPSLFIMACALVTLVATFRIEPWLRQIGKME